MAIQSVKDSTIAASKSSDSAATKQLKYLENNRKFVQEMIKFQGSSVSFSEDSDPASNMSKTTELMMHAAKLDVSINELEARISEEGAGAFKNHEEVLGKVVDYNDNGRIGSKVENSISFSYNIDQARLPEGAKLVSTTLKVLNQNAVVQTTKKEEKVKSGLNSFSWEQKKTNSDDTYTLQVDLTIKDADGKERVIKDIADYRSMVEQIKSETGKLKKKLVLASGNDIDLEQVIGVKPSRGSRSDDKIRYSNMIGFKASVDGKEFIVGGVDWSNPEEIQVYGDDNKKYSLSDIKGLAGNWHNTSQEAENYDRNEGDESDQIEASALSKAPMSNERRLELLLQGNNLVGKKVTFQQNGVDKEELVIGCLIENDELMLKISPTDKINISSISAIKSNV